MGVSRRLTDGHNHPNNPSASVAYSTSSPPIQIRQNPIFDDYFLGPLPRSAKDPSLPIWIGNKMSSTPMHHNLSYFVCLVFYDARLNIGEISEGVVKSTIDCLYPVIGGTEGKPEDWRIECIQIEKDRESSSRKGLHISIWELS
jgi:hypothetical protein